MKRSEQLIAYAKHIAIYQDYPCLRNGLQPLYDYEFDGKQYKGLYSKLTAEQEEFAQAKDTDHQYHEAADLIYYSTCIDYQNALETGVPTHLYTLQCKVIQAAGLSIELANSAAMTKYGWRAERPGNKDEDYEIALIKKAQEKVKRA